MTVFIFAGSDFYPKAHLVDLAGTLQAMPSTEEVARLVRRIEERTQLEEFPGFPLPDWVTAFAPGTDVGQAPTRKAWRVLGYVDVSQSAPDCCVWQDAEGVYRAVKEVHNLPALRLAPL
jgi:hypothetical protein